MALVEIGQGLLRLAHRLINQAAAAIGLSQFRRGVDGLVILAKGGIVILLGEMLAPRLEMAGNLAAAADIADFQYPIHMTATAAHGRTIIVPRTSRRVLSEYRNLLRVMVSLDFSVFVCSRTASSIAMRTQKPTRPRPRPNHVRFLKASTKPAITHKSRDRQRYGDSRTAGPVDGSFVEFSESHPAKPFTLRSAFVAAYGSSLDSSSHVTAESRPAPLRADAP